MDSNQIAALADLLLKLQNTHDGSTRESQPVSMSYVQAAALKNLLKTYLGAGDIADAHKRAEDFDMVLSTIQPD